MVSMIYIILIFTIHLNNNIDNQYNLNILHLIKYIPHLSLDGKSLIASCVGSAKYGPAVYVDFYKINRPCTCIVTPSFVGNLLVVSRKVIVAVCNTQIVINKMIAMGCPLQYDSAQLLNVNINQPVDVRAEYASQYTSGTFFHCIGFQQNGMIDSILQDLKISKLDCISTMVFYIML